MSAAFLHGLAALPFSILLMPEGYTYPLAPNPRWRESPGTARDCWQVAFELTPPGLRLEAAEYVQRFRS